MKCTPVCCSGRSLGGGSEGEYYEDGRGGVGHCRERGRGCGGGNDSECRRRHETEEEIWNRVETEEILSWKREISTRGGRSPCREGGRGVEHYRERGEGGTEYRRKRRCIILLQRRSRWREGKERLCSAAFESGIESHLLGLTEKQGKREEESESERKREKEMLTHISITMCQWSVCEVSCCLVTVLQQQQQHQCLCLYVSSSQWWVSARLSHCSRHVDCLESILLLTRISVLMEIFHPEQIPIGDSITLMHILLQTIGSAEEIAVPSWCLGANVLP